MLNTTQNKQKTDLSNKVIESLNSYILAGSEGYCITKKDYKDLDNFIKLHDLCKKTEEELPDVDEKYLNEYIKQNKDYFAQ